MGIGLELVRDLRERELPVVPPGEFNRVVEETWQSPENAVAGGESNLDAQTRGLAAVRGILTRHPGQHVVVCTHGTLFTLILTASIRRSDTNSGTGFHFRTSIGSSSTV